MTDFQIFTRDLSFVIEDKIILSNMINNRSLELPAINHIIDQIAAEKIIRLNDDCHIEGGDVILCNEHVFIGVYSGKDYSNYITARTNMNAVNALRELFPKKIIMS